MTHKAPKLLDQVRIKMRQNHYAYKTEQAYLHWIKRFILFHNKRHPQDMAEPEVEAFLTHLSLNRQVAASTQNQAFHAILFLYQHVIGRELNQVNAHRAKQTTPKTPSRHDQNRNIASYQCLVRHPPINC